MTRFHINVKVTVKISDVNRRLEKFDLICVTVFMYDCRCE